tara:strand:- start:25011 stop:25274 length:264 start_codon:yes stop_codon:yes gene_type:complete
MNEDYSNINHNKYINEEVRLGIGEAKIFIWFLLALLIFKNTYILILFLITYLFSIYLYMRKSNFNNFLKQLRIFIKGRKIKRSKDTY